MKRAESEQPPLGPKSLWLVSHLHARFLRSILDTLLNFKTKSRELESALFQLRLVLSSLRGSKLEPPLFREVLRTLSKTMVTYKDDDHIVKKVMFAAEGLRNSVEYEAGLQVFLFLCKQDHHQGAGASLEATAFLMFIYLTSGEGPLRVDSLKGLRLFTSTFLEIKDGVVANVNVAMFVHDSLLRLTGATVSSTQKTDLEGTHLIVVNSQKETSWSRASSNWS